MTKKVIIETLDIGILFDGIIPDTAYVSGENGPGRGRPPELSSLMAPVFNGTDAGWSICRRAATQKGEEPVITVLGIDIGSVAVSVALIDDNKTILTTSYCFHHGSIKEKLTDILCGLKTTPPSAIAVTSSTPDIIAKADRYDTQLSVIRGVRHLYPDTGSILFVGGQNYGLITFNERGEYKSYRANSSCAAGTGSFLDQQAKRLNIGSSSELSGIALSNRGNERPGIATRCAVFTKTDLIHAQQQGYSVGQISDGLCEGLARNIIETLIPDESKIRTPLIFAGGVSMNRAVVKHIRNLLSREPVVGEYSQVYGAIGAALLLLEEKKPPAGELHDILSVIRETAIEKTYAYKPLRLCLSRYPEFSSEERYLFTPRNHAVDVEVDVYGGFESDTDVYLGIDIGSTSTKAVLIDRQNNVLAGFYTRTAGRPIRATQTILEAIDDIMQKKKISITFQGVGTTGSGRKFIGTIINADLVIDEITTHARAAYELDPEVDTIIEIGGQDSKFTTLNNGMVTFSVMNNVCAAGTGSFIEEQAEKLGCPLTEYSRRAMNTPSPLASDRCTVFMERDINHYLVSGYSVDEVLASVLHSVRENYLTKVSVEAHIGKKICFQGATAKNKALVAAFEQKLQKPIFVSKYCHVTGALGCALILAENKITGSKFRGIGLYKEEIPFETDVCGLCLNKCKINKVIVQGVTVVFGFLCGRDADTKRYVNNKKNVFNLVDEYRKVFSKSHAPIQYRSVKTIGIPRALFLSEELTIWEHFFNTLGMKVVSSETVKEPIAIGKRIAGGEFCAPVSAYFGHVKYLSEKADYIFLPVYLENRNKEKEKIRQYCYYSQFASSLAASITGLRLEGRIIMPVIDTRHFNTAAELYKILKPLINCTYWSVYFAYQRALDFMNERRERLKNIFKREFDRTSDISVLFIGRPYTILEKNMNKGIPDFFESLEIKTFYQDMLTFSKEDTEEIEDLLKAFHWYYASKILESAVIAAKTKGLYPVYITSFKCGPDSFAIEYFKRIMDRYQKPYLILQLDEHGSGVGYETRIEAAVRSFRNHFARTDKAVQRNTGLPVVPVIDKRIKGKTLLFPCWDPIASRLIEAVLIKEGIDARMVELSEHAIQLGPRSNTGMCIPVNIIIQSYLDYMTTHHLDPRQTVLWMFDSDLACNIKLYPSFIKSMFESYGKGMENVAVYIGDIMFTDISIQAAIDAYFAQMLGGMLRKIGCKIRPYETEKGMTDTIIGQSLSIFYNMFLGNRNKEDDVRKVVNLFKGIDISPAKRPKVAVFGDIYVRDNDVMNQDLIHCIENYGGEVITMPFSDILKLVANPFIERSMRTGTFFDAFAAKAMVTIIDSLEKTFFKLFNEILEEQPFDWNINYREALDYFNVKIEQTGESADNLINIYALHRRYPDIALFVQTNPAFCCAGLVTEAMRDRIESLTGVPVATLTYDGTRKNINQALIPYISYAGENVR
ncbi:MAG: hypothetical protein JW881_10645 [Spirochaetales bacterium]|nr:hypothetical protein [Spirochaetales bacterium]